MITTLRIPKSDVLQQYFLDVQVAFIALIVEVTGPAFLVLQTLPLTLLHLSDVLVQHTTAGRAQRYTVKWVGTHTLERHTATRLNGHA